jgi:hypothetical protein
MKAVSAPPVPAKTFLPPPEETATGWEALRIGAERKINHALTVSQEHPLDIFNLPSRL